MASPSKTRILNDVPERLDFTVRLTPPSVNHYVKHFRNGGHVKTGEAQAFKDAVAIYAKGGYVVGKTFSVTMKVVLAEKQKGDVDNFPKLVLDGLADAGVFRNKKGERISDAHVRHMTVYVQTDERPERGYTEIRVETLL